MSVTYAPETKRIKLLFCERENERGEKLLTPLGFQKVWYMDEDLSKGKPSAGPYLEPTPYSNVNESYSFSGEGNRWPTPQIIGFEIVSSDPQTGGELGHWKHPFI